MTKDWLESSFPSNAERAIRWPEPQGETVTLWRPVDEQELRLIAQSGWQNFPPRLPDQPICYPVLNFVCAEKIARDWKAKRNTPPVGFVTEFNVPTSVATRYEMQTVGSADTHQEPWIPAEALDTFNAAVLVPIRVVAQHGGRHYTGQIDPDTHLPTNLGKETTP